jgi:outer membrane immunogenic protein
MRQMCVQMTKLSGRCGWRARLAAALLATGVALVAGSTGARAQSQPYNWSGPYLGGNVGGAWASERTAAAAADWIFDPLFVPFIAANGASATTSSGFTGGAQAGWNWQAGRLVWGVEGDIRALSLASTSDTGYVNDPHGPADSRFVQTTKTEWLATLRGRAGIALGDILLHATGGVAFGDVKSSYNYNVLWYGYDSHGSAATVKAGWTAGAGIEVPLNAHWAVGVEYLHFDLGSLNYSTKDRISFYHENVSTSVQGGLVTAKVNYRF